MIYSISGEVEKLGANYVVIDVHGMAFKVVVSVNTAQAVSEGGKIKLLTYFYVREDVLALYGFMNAEELELFELIISVSGIGPRAGMAIMSLASAQRLKAAISSGEAELLQKSSGIGKKTAERIVLELKDKVGSDGGGKTIELIEADSDVYEALTSLGYSQTQAKKALSKINPEVSGIKDRLREALKLLKQ